MTGSIILFLPVAACFFWMAITAMMASRTHTFRLFLGLLLATGLFLLTDAFYDAPGTPYSILRKMALLSQFTAPCLMPLVWMYMRALRRHELPKVIHYIWILVPVTLFTGGILLTHIAGDVQIEAFLRRLYTEGNDIVQEYQGGVFRTYYYWVVVAFRLVLLVEVLLLLGAYIRTFVRQHFHPRNVLGFFRGQKIRLIELQSFFILLLFFIFPLKALLYKDFLDQHVWISFALSLLLVIAIFAISYTSMFASKAEVSIHDMRISWRYNFGDQDKSEVVEEMISDLVEDAETEALKRIQGKIGESLDVEAVSRGDVVLEKHLAADIFAAVANAWDDGGLLSRFQQLMFRDRKFLQPGLTLADVADALNTNKTYVSKMVNNTYNLGFPELLNTLRIDYAEEYILHHRDARQDEIAKACGFVSASTFNIIFKKVTGVTPKVWIASQSPSIDKQA